MRDEHLHGKVRSFAVGPGRAEKLKERFQRLRGAKLSDLEIRWEPNSSPCLLLGTAVLGSRIQPFELLLESIDGEPAVRCVSPVGRVEQETIENLELENPTLQVPRVGAILSKETGTYNLTVEDVVLLAGDASTDRARVALMVKRVIEHADELEQRHLPGKDQPLEEFRTDLEQKEPEHVR